MVRMDAREVTLTELGGSSESEGNHGNIIHVFDFFLNVNRKRNVNILI
jgi:hypothetical protein